MGLETIYIARHGFRSNWAPGPIPDPPTKIDSDHTLSSHGLEQAEELGNHIATLNPRPELLFSSPFYRCIQTSTPIAKVLNEKIKIEPGIGEWYKPTRKVIPKPATVEFLTKFFDDLDTSWQPSINPSEDGETVDEMLARSKEFWKKFLAILENKFPSVKSIILVCHAASKIALGMALLGYNSVYDEINFNGDKYLKAGACSLDTFKLEDGKWELKVNGDTSFLSKGEEMNWHFVDQVEAGSKEDMEKRQKTQKPRKEKEPIYADDELENFYVTFELPPEIRSSINTSSSNTAAINCPQSSAQGFVLNHQWTETPNRETFLRNSSKNDSINYLTGSRTPYNANSKIQLSGLESEEPLIKINDMFFKGNWKQLVGTELIFDSKGEIIAKVKDHIEFVKGELTFKAEDKKKDNSGTNGEFAKLSTFEQALYYAKKKAEEDEEQKDGNSKDVDMTIESDIVELSEDEMIKEPSKVSEATENGEKEKEKELVESDFEMIEE